MSIALMLFVGLLLLYVVASGKARSVFDALAKPPAAAVHSDTPVDGSGG